MNLIWIIIISIISILGMIFCSIYKPTLKIKKVSISTFWLFPFLGALIILSFSLLDFKVFTTQLLSNTSMNPIEILLLFFSMTFMSIVLDEVGFFAKLAEWSVNKARGSQIKLFIILYLMVSLLTIFTSNDIVIITFTPFIIFFTKRTKISAIPYLIMEFIAANTWSLLFIISNPTNIYIASTYNITFLDYLKAMWLPTLLVSIVSFSLMFLIFFKKLKEPLSVKNKSEVQIKDKFILITSLIILLITVILMIISSYINISMWLIASCFACLLIIMLLIYSIIKRSSFKITTASFKRLPYDLVPFLLSMFVIVLAFNDSNITENISNILNNDYPTLTYGLASFISADLINNIPMSVLFSNLTSYIIEPTNQMKAIYSSIAGSNIGAFLTPLGALAGLMWMSILKKYEIKFSFLDFIKYGAIIAIPTILIAIAGIELMFLIV
ncbi:MAG: hypothetical protein LBM03_01705 [Erysipelotrichaceae bacterium]|jgi:arsenical pump membrane protein|nr:hypothetical protein [Erysipelotrichaceae bacterium]